MTENPNKAPLIFLTTTDSHTPTGRNARAKARTISARRSNPTSTVKGTFGSFSVVSHDPGTSSDDDSHPKKRPRRKQNSTIHPADKRPTTHTAHLLPTTSIRFLAAHFETGYSPITPNCNLDDVLKVAAFHIRRTAGRIIFSQPERALEALRCRQWCSITSAPAYFGRAPYLDSAIACVVSKVQQVITGGKAEEQMLFSYTFAIHHLRAAVLDPTLHDIHDMLTATRLLAVYEMLDFPNNGTWVQHVAGAAAMAKLQDSNTTGHSLRSGQFVEALLNIDHEFFEGPSWKILMQAMVSEQKSTPNFGSDITSCFVTLRLLFADLRIATQDQATMSPPTRFSLLARAHEVRCRIKKVILASEKMIEEGRKKFKEFDFLGMFLLVVITLDRLILSLRPSMGRGGRDLQDDTREFSAQLIRLELRATEDYPEQDLLRAFQRQTEYPLLVYDG